MRHDLRTDESTRRPTSRPIARSRWVVACALLTTVGAGGCFSYHTRDVSELEASNTVRVRLADQEIPRLRAFIEAREATVSGEFLGATADSLTMVVQTPVAFQEISIPRSSVLQVETREADVVRNILITAGVVGGVGLLAYLGFEGEGNNINRPGEQPDEARIPIFTLGFPLP